MIAKTLKKIKETSDAIASIAKSFSTIMVSLVAAITASISGYKEVRKFTRSVHEHKIETSQTPEIARATNSAENISISRNSGNGVITGTIQPTGTVSVETKYEMDSNTIILAIALIILPLIWYFDRKKKTNAKS